MNTTDQNDLKLFEDMKECVHRAGLPVFYMPCACEVNPYGFSSKIVNDSKSVELWAQYDAPAQYATFRFVFEEKVQAQDIGAAKNLLNELNSRLATYHYSICPDFGGIELKAGLYVPKKGFPKENCIRLLMDLICEIKDIYPAMIRVTKDNGTFEDLRRILRGDEKTSYEVNPDSMSTMKGKHVNNIMEYMRVFLARTTLPIANTNDYKKDKYICIDTKFSSVPELLVRVVIQFEEENKCVVLSVASVDTVPKEKIPDVMELINLINRECVVNHLWFHTKKQRVILTKGIMIQGESVDTGEFENAVLILLVNGNRFLKAVRDLVSSDEKPKEIMKRISFQ